MTGEDPTFSTNFQITSKPVIDLLIAWDWEFDLDFINTLKRKSKDTPLKKIEDITVYDLDGEFYQRLIHHEIHVRAFLDRASDANPQFLPLYKSLCDSGTQIINPIEVSSKACDKSQMHYKLIDAGIHVPNSVILPSFDHMPKLDEYHLSKLRHLPSPFILKPANGGGGEGVHRFVRSLDYASQARKEWAWDRYLAQEKIVPRFLSGSRCWFRAYSFFGRFDAVWWNDETKIYKSPSAQDRNEPWFQVLIHITKTISEVIEQATGKRLDYFSTEIAMDKHDQFIVIDYVNDQIDLRPKSKHFDGVPDGLVEEVAMALIDFISKTSN
ncbi:MAG: hypothetical protein SFU91_01405 [Chloroherpetonaceae bacterium]|nr:hypothetical protein [Chloroherpetonaceae bacterium]